MNPEKEKAMRSLKTAKGQIEVIIKMIEDERYCMDISNQIAAAHPLLKKSQLMILKQHLKHCETEAVKENKVDEKNDDIMKIIEKIIS